MKTTTGINLIQAAPGIFVDPIKRHELALAPDEERKGRQEYDGQMELFEK